MILVCYDIENDNLRTKVARKLQHWGLHRVQYSVFMGFVEKRKIPTLWKDMEEFTQTKSWNTTDNIMLVPIHQSQTKNIRVHGNFPPRWEEIVGEIHTLML